MFNACLKLLYWLQFVTELPTVLLNSHYDVVPASEAFWNVDPWAAVRENGRIYGRGTQDMKVSTVLVVSEVWHAVHNISEQECCGCLSQCVCAQYMLAMERLLASGFKPRRTIHLSYVPDEEVGGEGMASLLASEIFKTFNVGLALDEGIANPGPTTTPSDLFIRHITS